MSDVLVAGVDSSTQATKVVVCRAATGEVVREARASHPEGTEVDPERWWEAYGSAVSGGLLDGVSALSVGGQQHGMVALDETGAVVRPALLWNDTRSAQDARDLVDELGGPEAWAEAVGSVPVAAFTVAKLRWLARREPESAARTAEVVLPHDWLTGRLLSGSDAGLVTPGTVTTDRGDASGTGYWSPGDGGYRPDLVERALGHGVALPDVAADIVVGHAPTGLAVCRGTGDNMATALGLGLGPGDVVVSLGTSGTVFAEHDRPTVDPSGAVAGFADAQDGFLPLVCTLNAARVLTAAARLAGADLNGLDALALSAPAGAEGLSFLPYLDGERTPNRPDASGTLGGLTRANATPAHLLRAAVEGMLCGLADGLEALTAQGVSARRIVLVGGAARSRAVRAAAPDLFGLPVVVPAPAEYVALGAARQAAGALADDELPRWARHDDVVLEPVALESGAAVRDRYRDLRDTMA